MSRLTLVKYIQLLVQQVYITISNPLFLMRLIGRGDRGDGGSRHTLPQLPKGILARWQALKFVVFLDFIQKIRKSHTLRVKYLQIS